MESSNDIAGLDQLPCDLQKIRNLASVCDEQNNVAIFGQIVRWLNENGIRQLNPNPMLKNLPEPNAKNRDDLTTLRWLISELTQKLIVSNAQIADYLFKSGISVSSASTKASSFVNLSMFRKFRYNGNTYITFPPGMLLESLQATQGVCIGANPQQ